MRAPDNKPGADRIEVRGALRDYTLAYNGDLEPSFDFLPKFNRKRKTSGKRLK